MINDREVLIRSKITECAIDETVEITNRLSIDKEFKHLYKAGVRECKIEHLTKGSEKRIKIKCPQCGLIRDVIYFSCFKSTFTGLCRSCNMTNIGKVKTNAKDLSGQVFGRLTALEPTEKRYDGKVVWKCQCECGSIVYISTGHLQSGHTKSCGCLIKEKSSERIINYHRSQGHRIPSDYTDEENAEYYKESNSFYNNSKWKNLRKEILQKSDECYICHSSLNPHVHHILNRKEYPSKSYDQDNLITLCAPCHVAYHQFINTSNFEQNQSTLQIFKSQFLKEVA